MSPGDFYVLLALSEAAAQRRRIADGVLALTGGEYGATDADVAESLRALADRGWAEPVHPPGRPEGGAPVEPLYRITQAGRDAVVAETRRLAGILAVARQRFPEELG
jgi:hypothetical protein